LKEGKQITAVEQAEEESIISQEFESQEDPLANLTETFFSRIRSIDGKGQVLIEFTTGMFDQSNGLNISLIDENVLEISIIPN